MQISKTGQQLNFVVENSENVEHKTETETHDAAVHETTEDKPSRSEESKANDEVTSPTEVPLTDASTTGVVVAETTDQSEKNDAGQFLP